MPACRTLWLRRRVERRETGLFPWSSSSRIQQWRTPLPMLGSLFEGVGELQNVPVCTMPSDDLKPDGQPTLCESRRYGNRGIRHERDVPARTHPVDVRGHADA